MIAQRLLVGAVILCGARAAFAQGAVDAGTPAPDRAAPGNGGDGGAMPAAPGAPETTGGLFEQSQAASAAPSAGAETAAVKPTFTLNGYARGDVFAGKVPDQNAGEMKANYGELALQLRTAKSTFGDGFADARVRYGLQGDQQGTFLDLREAYVNAYVGPFDLRLGKQIIVWGRADALNPTNNLTPVDFRIRSPLEDDIRLGNVGARAFLRLWVLRLEGVWMPTYLPTELPPVSLPAVVQFGPTTFPSQDLRNGTAAGRLHLELPAFEMSISYLHGYAPLPGLTLNTIRFDPVSPAVLISRTAYNQQVLGLDFSTALGDVLTVRGEAAYRRPYDYKSRIYAARPDLQYVVGGDHNFGSLNVIVQYLGRYVFDWQKEPGTAMDLNNATSILKMDPDPANNPGIEATREMATEIINAELAQTNQILFSQTAQVQHVATLRFEWLAAHETLSISALGMLNFTTHEWLATPRIGYRFTDAMTGYLGAQIFRGPTDTLFGLIDETLSAGYAELRFTY